ncbi:helix-turn-helix domain-containing protein [Larkinella terrae]|uniref:Helix-turn-helix domain-containing protein n=1 Tax=Larkinella terrae TaxID=2025311 RepID=A0A7K0EH94_9BACT|nr:helix-turn-helix transcriptional regulator [Larkinella terrae]MRS61229.1 helix-turn-helix domain-containing protein [Larkinella terrae]
MSNTPEEIGQLIRNTRKNRSLTQKELGRRLGISESAVNKYESGKENPTLQTLSKIADALDMKLSINFIES